MFGWVLVATRWRWDQRSGGDARGACPPCLLAHQPAPLRVVLKRQGTSSASTCKEISLQKEILVFSWKDARKSNLQGNGKEIWSQKEIKGNLEILIVVNEKNTNPRIEIHLKPIWAEWDVAWVHGEGSFPNFPIEYIYGSIFTKKHVHFQSFS